MSKVEYTALRYYNSAISEECLYVGMLYNNITTGKRDFRHISNFQRFQAFDDEADIEFVKRFLKGVKERVEENLFNYNKEFNTKEFIRIFVNDFRFSKIVEIEVDEEEDYVEDLTKIFLKFDYSKNNRLTTNNEKKYIKKILLSKYGEFSSPEVNGNYDEEIVFDYMVENTAIKFFSFKDKELKRMIPMAKQWAFTANEVVDKYNVYFLYDLEVEGDIFKSIINILKSSGANVLDINQGLELIMKDKV